MKLVPSNYADVLRNHWPVEPDKSVNLYIGTGRCGGCFDSYGLQHRSDTDSAATRVSHTRLSHADVWHRGRYGLDSQVPLTRLVWSENIGEPQSYQQHLQLATGTLETQFVSPGFSYVLRVSASPAEADRDLLRLHLLWSGSHRPKFCIEPVRNFISDYGDELPAETDLNVTSDCASFRIARGTSRGLCLVRYAGDLCAVAEGDLLRLELLGEIGTAILTLALGPESRRSVLTQHLATMAAVDQDSWEEQAAAAWKIRWGAQAEAPTGLPAEYAALYQRSHYHLLCSYAPEVRCPAPPMGFTGNAWGRHFPQDLAYIHPALLALGHSDITRAHVEFYHRCLADQLRLTREFYDKPGICWSWEYPIGKEARLFRPEEGGVPNEFQFEIHNAAYPAKMALETAASLNDPAWTRAIAWPVVCESARFLFACLQCEADGTHSVVVTPSMGQDEFGGPNAKNYLCALFATEYTLGQAVRLAADLGYADAETEAWAKVLSDGLAYARLIHPEYQIYAANESVPFEPRRQKHPVQLNPLWLLPLGREPDAATLSAYRQRRVICSSERDNQRHPGVPTGFYDGWTLFAFQLSAARMGDRAGFAHELREMLPARAIDPDHITIYESSGFWQAYYTTSMGLFMQAVWLQCLECTGGTNDGSTPDKPLLLTVDLLRPSLA